MTGQWKPGDVAMASWMGESIRGIIDTDGRFYTTDQRAVGISSSSFALANLRPLVVIDPEDREQVERFAREYEKTWTGGAKSSESTVDIIARQMQAALRSLIAPPEPEEPTGLGAVVEDADGYLWTFSGGPQPAEGRVWYSPNLNGTALYADINAVRILSGGVA